MKADYMAAPRLAHKGRKALVSTRGFITAGTRTYSNQIVPFPIDIKGRFEGYFSLAVRGNSLIEAGINDGDYLLMRKAEAPENEAIMLILYEGHSTVKRVKMHKGQVFLCWEDGSGRQMGAAPGGYEVQGKFVAIERKPVKRPTQPIMQQYYRFLLDKLYLGRYILVETYSMGFSLLSECNLLASSGLSSEVYPSPNKGLLQNIFKLFTCLGLFFQKHGTVQIKPGNKNIGCLGLVPPFNSYGLLRRMFCKELLYVHEL
jgi:hypothetical protein